jgi:UDP-N-acetylmuramate dehydrogenase
VPYELDAPLGEMTWYRVGGRAACLAHPQSREQLAKLAQVCSEQAVTIYVMGSGANLLVADEGVRGLVVRLDAEAFRELSIDGPHITAGAGYDLGKLVLRSAQAGLAGLHSLAGIPASVGGALRMNAGGAFGEIGQFVSWVDVMDASGRTFRRHRDDLEFGYRSSNIVARYILAAGFELTPDDPEALVKRVKEIFFYKKTTQPMSEHSAGCAFKNPPESAVPSDLPASAGALIEQAGLKGHQIGQAQVSPKHANFMIALPGCTAADLIQLIEHVQKTVLEHFGVELQREVVIWP